MHPIAIYRCSLANGTNKFLIGAVHRTAPITEQKTGYRPCTSTIYKCV